MLNKLYGKIKNSDFDFIFGILMFGGGIISIAALIMLAFDPKVHAPIGVYVGYAIGFVISFILSSQIDYSINLSQDESESEARSVLMWFSFIWPGYIFALLGLGIGYFVYGIGMVFAYLHENLCNIHSKIKFPTLKSLILKEPKPKPAPKQGVYRDPAETCGTCGGIK